MQWNRETNELSKQEYKTLDDKIQKLQPFEEPNCQIHFSLHLTMIDGKVNIINSIFFYIL